MKVKMFFLSLAAMLCMSTFDAAAASQQESKAVQDQIFTSNQIFGRQSITGSQPGWDFQPNPQERMWPHDNHSMLEQFSKIAFDMEYNGEHLDGNYILVIYYYDDGSWAYEWIWVPTA